MLLQNEEKEETQQKTFMKGMLIIIPFAQFSDYLYTEFYITTEMSISMFIANKMECLYYAAF